MQTSSLAADAAAAEPVRVGEAPEVGGEAQPARTRAWGRPVAVVGACTVVAVLALGLPVTLAYDPWAWLVWGREIVRLDLDTTGGPSWKPLPVLVAVPLVALGGLAPAAWLVVARVGGLLAFVGVYRLADRLAGRVAGALAAALLVLTPDTGPRWLRLVGEGHSAPFTATLTVWAVERHLAGRHATAAVLLTLLALDRPEAWPFLGVYVLWLARREPARRPALAALTAAVPLLWFGPDWWGSGSPLHGASAAQVFARRDDRVAMAIDNVLEVVVTPAWIVALVAAVVLWRWGRRDVVSREAGSGGNSSARDAARGAPRPRISPASPSSSLLASDAPDSPNSSPDLPHGTLPTLVGLSLAWMGLVVVMGVLQGYAALPRFQLPGAVLVCAGAAAGAVLLARALPPGARRAVPVAAVVALSAPFLVPRTLSLQGLADDVFGRGRDDRDLVAVLDDAGGLDRLRECGPLRVNFLRSSVAWRADVPMDDVIAVGDAPTGVVVVPAGTRAERRLAAAESGGSGAVALARRGRWVVYDVGCGLERPG